MYEEWSRNESWQHLRDQGPLCQKGNRGPLRGRSWAQPQKGSSAELMPICARECLCLFSFMAAPALRALLPSNFQVKTSHTKELREEVGACILTVMIHVTDLFPHFIDEKLGSGGLNNLTTCSTWPG